MAKSKPPDKKAAKSTPVKAAAQKPWAAPPRPAVDPKLAVRVVLETEIATLRAQLAALKQQLPANDPRLELMKNRLRARQIQRAKMGP